MKSIRALVIGLAALTVLLLRVETSVAGTAEEAKRRTAIQLAEESIAEHHRGDELKEDAEAAYDHGIELAERAVATDPSYADGYYALFLNLGRKSERSGLSFRMRNVGRLKSLLHKTIELDRHHAHAWEAMGEMLLQLPWVLGGSEEEGERALKRSAELDSRWPKPPLRLAEFYRKKGKVAAARAYVELARDLARAAGDADYLDQAERLLEQTNAGK